MKVSIIIIGNEVLSGETIDTNSAMIGQAVESVGLNVVFKIGIPDDKKSIINAIDQAFLKSDVILMTGGLGPTSDDITRVTLSEYFQTRLVFNDEIFNQIQELLKHRNRPINQFNRDQALIPESAKIFLNKLGSAPGLCFENNNKVLIAMPGVPYEMKEIMATYIIPFLQERIKDEVFISKNIRTVGIPESIIAEKIGDIEREMPANINLAYLPNLGEVKLRLTARGKDRIKINKQLSELKGKLEEILGHYIYAYDDDSLPATIGRLLLEKGKTLSIAESCTGGYISHQLTTVPGSSAWFLGSIIAYSNEVKMSELDVPAGLISHYGAVSEEVASAMAQGALNRLGSDFAVAVSGIAGPDGGTPDKPLGTIWVAVASKTKSETKTYVFDRGRLQNIQFACTNALNLLRIFIFDRN
jgi:nicotinamide-nucleotide amidase